MNSKQLVQAVLNRDKTDRIPVDIWCTPEILDMLMKHFGSSDELSIYKTMGIDKIVWNNAIYDVPEDRTLWGTKMRRVDAGEAVYMEVVEPGLAGIEEIKALDDYPYWPDPDKFDYDSMISKGRKVSANFAALGPWVSFFEIYCQLRGLEQAMMDLALEPDYVDAVLDKIEYCQTEMLKRFLGSAAEYTDMVFISDDMGSQEGLLMSFGMWERFFKERMKRWCDLIHSFGVKVFFHSDGACEELIPSLIDVGIDILNPIQHVCPGMDCAELKSKYGDKLIFHGGIENQSVLPFGTAEDVRDETLKCLKTLGRGNSGYICCSCHNIQPGTPVENILAMVKTVKGYK